MQFICRMNLLLMDLVMTCLPWESVADEATDLAQAPVLWGREIAAHMRLDMAVKHDNPRMEPPI